MQIKREQKKHQHLKKLVLSDIPFLFLKSFQIRNTNKTIKDSVNELDNILSISDKGNKEVVVYLSMCFGNPYGDPWNTDIINEWVFKLSKMGSKYNFK